MEHPMELHAYSTELSATFIPKMNRLKAGVRCSLLYRAKTALINP